MFDGVNVVYDVTVKVIGHQWYWEYELNVQNIFWDSEEFKSRLFRTIKEGKRWLIPFPILTDYEKNKAIGLIMGELVSDYSSLKSCVSK